MQPITFNCWRISHAAEVFRNKFNTFPVYNFFTRFVIITFVILFFFFIFHFFFVSVLDFLLYSAPQSFSLNYYLQKEDCIAPRKGIRFPESRNFLHVESEILGFGIRNPALGIRNPTKDWNPESNFLKIHSRLDWATRSKEKPSMESLPRVYASTWWHTV